jgi:ribonuclease HI
VVNKSAIGDVLTNPNATGRVAKWLIELGPLGIRYEHPKAIKAQVLPDFHTEWIEAQLPGVPDVSNSWTMYFDGSKKNEGAGAGVVLISPKGDKLRYVLQMGFEFPSNNEAEYEALIHGMRMAKAMGCTRIMIYGDSKLVVQQTMKACDSIADNMTLYHDLYNIMEGSFEGCELRHIGRESNEEADKLANIASTKAPIPPGVFFERLEHRSIDKRPSSSAPATGKGNIPSTKDPPVEVLLIEPTWTQPFLAYILRNELPKDTNESRRIIRRAKSYTIINGELYKRNTSGIFQRCIAFEDGKDLLRDIHAGTCGHHAGSRSIVAKAFRAGFYWPTALSDAEDIVKRCIGCQKFATRPHAPASALKTIPLAWPFAQWGLDMVGPLKKSSKGGHTHLLVAVDKFTKWIEAIPITSSTASTAVRFIQSIIYRYGVMDSIPTSQQKSFNLFARSKESC